MRVAANYKMLWVVNDSRPDTPGKWDWQSLLRPFSLQLPWRCDILLRRIGKMSLLRTSTSIKSSNTNQLSSNCKNTKAQLSKANSLPKDRNQSRLFLSEGIKGTRSLCVKESKGPSSDLDLFLTLCCWLSRQFLSLNTMSQATSITRMILMRKSSASHSSFQTTCSASCFWDWYSLLGAWSTTAWARILILGGFASSMVLDQEQDIHLNQRSSSIQ